MYRAMDDLVIAKPDAMNRYVHAYSPRRGPCCEGYVWETMINVSMTAFDLSHHAILDLPFAGFFARGHYATAKLHNRYAGGADVMWSTPASSLKQYNSTHLQHLRDFVGIASSRAKEAEERAAAERERARENGRAEEGRAGKREGGGRRRRRRRRAEAGEGGRHDWGRPRSGRSSRRILPARSTRVRGGC